MQIIGEPGLWRELSVFQEAHHPLGRVQYAPLRYARVCTCVHTHTGVHRQAAHLRSSHPLPPSTATRRCNVLRTGKIKCKYADEFNQNSSAISGENSRRGTTRPTIRPVSRLFRPRKGWAVKLWPSNLVAKGLHSPCSVAHRLKGKGRMKGEAIEKNLESTQQWLFVRLTRPSGKRYLESPTQRPRLFILPLVQMCRCIRHA